MDQPVSLSKGDQPVSLAKVDDAVYQQQQQQYEQQQQSIIQQQQLIIQQQQQQLQQLQQAQQSEQQLIQQQLYTQQQQLEQQQLELQRLQYERAQLQSAQLQAQLQKPIDPQQIQQIHQQLQTQVPENVGASGIATVNPEASPVEIANGVFHAPSSCEFVGGSRGNLKVRIIRGYNLMVGDNITKSSDPYVLIKSSCFASHPKTKFISNNLNPIWEETFFLTVESVRTELLMFKVYDHDHIGCDDLLGYFGINLSLLPLGVEVRTNEKLYFAKHGTIEIAITALDFGLTNIPANYISTYVDWRNNLVPLERKEFKNLPGTKSTSSFIAKTNTSMGPYYCKITHGDFKIIHGYPKLRKTSREKVADGFATAGIITAAVFAVIITAPFSGCNHHW